VDHEKMKYCALLSFLWHILPQKCSNEYVPAIFGAAATSSHKTAIRRRLEEMDDNDPKGETNMKHDFTNKAYAIKFMFETIQKSCSCFLCAILCVLSCLSALKAVDTEDNFHVKVAIKSEHETQKIHADLLALAKRQAIKSYILMCNSNIPDKILVSAQDNAPLYVTTSRKLNSKWTQIDSKVGQLEGDFVIGLSLAKINQWMVANGFMQQGKMELIILEELPDLAGIKLDNLLGSDVDGKKYFLQRYTTFQRRIRDAILKKMETYGFLINLLEDKLLYNEYKSKNGTLVGVYFDSTTDRFVLDTALLTAIKENNPNTLVLLYRIDAIFYIRETAEIACTVNLSIKDLKSGISRSIGTQSYRRHSSSQNKELLIDNIANCIESAINKLMNEERAAAKLNATAISIKNMTKHSRGALTFIVNASAFDPKVRKRVMYMMRKELLSKSLSRSDKITSTDTTMTVEIDPEKCRDREELYMEYIIPFLEKIGIELDDAKVHYDGNNLLIKP